MNDLQKRESAELARPERVDMAAQLMQVITANPTAGAENLKALLDGMERITQWQAKQEFTAAFARLKFPPFRKTAKGHNAKYAPLDDIQAIIDPILEAEGFTLTFSSGEANAKGDIPTIGLLSHVGGHSRDGVIFLPPDVTQTHKGGTTMNALQSVGSSTSYGMRYCAKLMLNLRFIDEDKDGSLGSDYITEQQAMNVEDLIAECSLGEAGRAKFLETFNCKGISELMKANYAPAINLLSAKRRNLGSKT